MEVLRRRSGRRRRRRRQWSGRTRSRRGGPRGRRALYAYATGCPLRLRLSCPGSSAFAVGRPLRLCLSRPPSPPVPEQLCLACPPPVRGGRRERGGENGIERGRDWDREGESGRTAAGHPGELRLGRPPHGRAPPRPTAVRVRAPPPP
ncbi:hypothetical protein DAI22_03g270200 [Oryza sativa Japonica Group]|nr:hypothetical protein DAI22_03g270200 [Oryza sativa Japonica Group]